MTANDVVMLEVVCRIRSNDIREQRQVKLLIELMEGKSVRVLFDFERSDRLCFPI